MFIQASSKESHFNKNTFNRNKVFNPSFKVSDLNVCAGEINVLLTLFMQLLSESLTDVGST